MSIEAMALVLHHSKATGTAKVVLLGVANHEGDGGARPAVATLAKYANVDPRSVRRALDMLVETGELEIIHKAGWASTYRVLVRCPKGCDRSSNHRLTVRPTPDASVTPDRNVTPDADVHIPLTPASPHPGHQRQGTPDASVTQTIQEPSENRPLNRARRSAGAPQPSTELVLVESDPAPITAQTLVTTWIDHCRARPPANVIGQVARHCAALLAEGIDPRAVEDGLAQWHSKGLHPSTLPSVVNEVLNPPSPRANGRRRLSPGDQALALIADMRERGIQ